VYFEEGGGMGGILFSRLIRGWGEFCWRCGLDGYMTCVPISTIRYIHVCFRLGGRGSNVAVETTVVGVGGGVVRLM